jgi:hypothetical protein
MKRVLVLSMVVALATAVQAVDISSSFTNLDFDSGITHIASGFDNPNADIIGWSDYPAHPLNDAGVEGPSAWWLPDDYAYGQAAFMSPGDGAYNMSNYIIQSGDIFTVSYLAGVWGWQGSGDGRGEWTATLFYDDPANVIGSYVQDFFWVGLADGVRFTDPVGITATPESVGGTLGILFQNTTGDKIAQIDEISVTVIPEPASFALLSLGSLVIFKKRKSNVI